MGSGDGKILFQARVAMAYIHFPSPRMSPFTFCLISCPLGKSVKPPLLLLRTILRCQLLYLYFSLALLFSPAALSPPTSLLRPSKPNPLSRLQPLPRPLPLTRLLLTLHRPYCVRSSSKLTIYVVTYPPRSAFFSSSASPPVKRPASPHSCFSQTYSRDPHRKIAFPSANPVPSGTSSPPFDTSLVSVSNTHLMATRAKAGVYKPNPKYAHHALVSTEDSFEPTSFSQANKLPEWRLAMADEFSALLRAGTWTLVPRTPTMNILPNKWVFRVKRNSDGTIQHYKARLVANGFHQQPGLDYGETFSPVVNHSTIHLILAFSVQFSWLVRQLDVQNAFLHGYLDEEVYMRQPVGFVDPTYPDHVCRLRPSLYGLKQAPCAWFHCFFSYLLHLGFIASQSDSSLFVYTQGSIHIYLLIYVDDILVTGSGSDPSRITILSLTWAASSL
ncbi:Glycosyl hydrolases family 31 protein [Prunus dulcis]|uniref:Glycosyl hydrolases family 31 protein n=1 Tax=Prunus dulcis TaxID=3755 RepID=A0A4Y1QYU2_PRUDU|nr:Glycosyl hydrolases family 31 protein [Prunus dulcis]